MAERVHPRASKFPFAFIGPLSLHTMNRPAISQLPTATILSFITEGKFEKGGSHGVQPSSSR
jgi:hypothetical protein